MNLSEKITRWMSLRKPQAEALAVLDGISAGLEYRNASLATVAEAASAQSRPVHSVGFDTEFPSFCFALATGVGKTRLMGASMAYLWRTKSYRHFFILAPNITIYDKLRAELDPAHPKYMLRWALGLPASRCLRWGQLSALPARAADVRQPRDDLRLQHRQDLCAEGGC